MLKRYWNYLPKYICYKVWLTSKKAIFQQELEPLSCTIAKSQKQGKCD